MLPVISLAALAALSDSGLQGVLLTLGNVSGKRVQVAPNSETDEVLPAGPRFVG